MNSCDNEKQCCGRNCSVAVAVVIACLIFAGLVWKMREYTTPTPLAAARAAERASALKELRAAEAIALNNVGWVDPAKGVVRLPVADAVMLAEKQWQNPAKARADLIARVDKATALPPKAPEKPSQFE